MSYIHEELDKRLQRERAQRIEQEFAAEDDGSFDRAIDEMEVRESMLLPKGKTCSDCRNWQFCSWFLAASIKPTNTICDWSPSKFVELEQEEARKRENAAILTNVTPEAERVGHHRI